MILHMMAVFGNDERWSSNLLQFEAVIMNLDLIHVKIKTRDFKEVPSEG